LLLSNSPSALPQSVFQVFTLAFLVVGATCIAMVPIMLYMLDLRKYGWEWIHACMFGAMIASTDAVAIVSIMKSSKSLPQQHQHALWQQLCWE
jgi:NhaP-type Na+/H+ or K+/H+ antiporter